MEYYFDSAATTKLHPKALEAMLPAFSEFYGNPSGSHSMARKSLRKVDDAREQLAELLAVKPSEIIFTSGGTESDNFAIKGPSTAERKPATFNTEHHAVLEPVECLDGAVMPVDESGVAIADAIKDLPETTSVVSCMAANNEIGTLQPIAEVAAQVRENLPTALFHVDAVQGFCWLNMSEITSAADLVSLSAHKFGGPKGIGVLVSKKGCQLEPQLVGGSQERGKRSGTLNVPGIVGMAAAAVATVERKAAKVSEVKQLRDRLSNGIKASLPDAVETVFQEGRLNILPNIAHFCFPEVASEALIFLLEREEIMASAASSCASGAMQPSHVLTAIGYSKELASGSLRLSLSYETTEAEVDHVIEKVTESVNQIRKAKK